jgi:hypothetical protein
MRELSIQYPCLVDGVFRLWPQDGKTMLSFALPI